MLESQIESKVARKLRAQSLLEISSADVAVGVEQTRTRGSQEAFSTTGERVFAVCYNRVRMSPKSVSDAVLDRENVWKLFTNREKNATDVEEQDAWYEADLDDVASDGNGKLDSTGKGNSWRKKRTCSTIYTRARDFVFAV